MPDTIKDLLLSIKYSTYSQFRALDILDLYRQQGEFPSFTDDVIDNFRNIIKLVVMCECYPKYKFYIYDHQFEQMMSEYMCWSVGPDSNMLPSEFVVHCDFMKDTEGSFTRLYQLFSNICNKSVSMKVFCAMMPYIVVMSKTKHKLEKRDVRILERIAHSILTQVYVRGSKRVDINSDFMNIRDEFTKIVTLVFKDTRASSRYTVDRTVCLFREIAILWCICVLQRTKTTVDSIDTAVSALLTRKLTEYRAIANTI